MNTKSSINGRPVVRHATAPCPTCGGSGHVPASSGEYVIHYRYQDCTEYQRFPKEQAKKAWATAKRAAATDPSVNIYVEYPDGKIVGVG